MKIIHAIADKASGPGFKIKIGRDARSRCGIVACVVATNVGPTRHEMIDANGNDFLGTTRPEVVTCQKCINLQTVGTIHDRTRRATDAQKRTVAHAKRPAARTARTHAGPR